LANKPDTADQPAEKSRAEAAIRTQRFLLDMFAPPGPNIARAIVSNFMRR
jgi:hypothetical protein